MPERIVLSVSDLKLYNICPQLFMYQHVNRLGPAGGKSEALLLGTAVHSYLAGILSKTSCDPFDSEEFALAGPEVQTEVRESFNRLPLDQWQPPDRWEVVDVEKELRAPLGDGVELVGRLDCVVRAMGKLWHLQHKTIAATKPVDVFAEVMRTDWHEIAYQWLAAQHYDEPFGGTILNCIRKLSQKSIAAGTPVFNTFYLTRPDDVVAQGMEDITDLADRMAWDIAAYQINIPVMKNRAACGGMFGNSLCAYKDVCDQRRELSTMGFVEIEPRYEQSSGD